MDDLVAFLRARLDEDEARALKARGEWDAEWVIAEWQDLPDEVFTQTRTYDPARVLREVAAKRVIAERHTVDVSKVSQFLYDPYTGERVPDRYDVSCVTCDYIGDDPSMTCDVLRHLAAVYSDHPEYRDEWKP
jgi:hypothetical protein